MARTRKRRSLHRVIAGEADKWGNYAPQSGRSDAPSLIQKTDVCHRAALDVRNGSDRYCPIG